VQDYNKHLTIDDFDKILDHKATEKENVYYENHFKICRDCLEAFLELQRVDIFEKTSSREKTLSEKIINLSLFSALKKIFFLNFDYQPVYQIRPLQTRGREEGKELVLSLDEKLFSLKLFYIPEEGKYHCNFTVNSPLETFTLKDGGGNILMHQNNINPSNFSYTVLSKNFILVVSNQSYIFRG